MRINYRWLQEYVPVTESPDKLGQDLTMVGLPLEELDVTRPDPVLEFDVTSNRGDCLSHLGIAREVAALYGLEPTPPDCSTPICVGPEIPFEVQIHNPKLCRRYCALVLSDVQIGPSPDWLRERLESIGQRAVNNVVDITNYVLQELGHPLHAFDLDKLRGDRIIVRTAQSGEHLLTLDGLQRDLDPSMLLIADAERPVALAGIMGGEDSEISFRTTRVLLESAHFDPVSIRRTSKRLGLSTEASYHFERDADIENAARAIARCAHLLRELASGRVASPLIDIYPGRRPRRTIVFNPLHASRLMGVDIDPEFSHRCLETLGFGVERKRKYSWRVTVPTHRQDVEMDVDLVEEVGRHFGYNRVPSTHSAWRGVASLPVWRPLETVVGTTLRGLGYSETVNTSFATQDELDRFAGYDGQPVEVTNPLSTEETRLRWHLLPMLLRNCRHNLNHGIKSQRLFELGKVYFKKGDGSLTERKRLGMLVTGLAVPPSWSRPSEEMDLYRFKGEVAALMNTMGLSSFTFRTQDTPTHLNPRLSVALWQGDTLLGYLGQLDAALEEGYRLRQPVFVCDLDVQTLYDLCRRQVRYTPVPKYPPVLRDISFVIDRRVRYDTIETVIGSAGVEALRNVELVDLYPVQPGDGSKVSLTVRLIYQSSERTLTVEEANAFDRILIGLLEEKVGATLRH